MKVVVLKAGELADPTVAALTRPYFFSSPAFASAFDPLGGQPHYLALEDTGRLIALVPGVEFGLPGLKRWQGMPDGCYGRLLGDLPEDQRHAAAKLVLQHLQKAPYSKLYLTDIEGDFACPEGWPSQSLSTSLVDVSAPDWMPPDKKMRQQIRKAEREGQGVIAFDPAIHMTAFLKLVSLSSSRQGRPPKYPPPFYEALAALAVRDDRLRWLWMEVDGHNVASSLFVVEGNQLLHWHVFFDDSLSDYQPSKYLPFVAARRFAAEGGRYLNLGATPDDLPGVEEYKRKWGGAVHRYQCLHHESGVGRLL